MRETQEKAGKNLVAPREAVGQRAARLLPGAALAPQLAQQREVAPVAQPLDRRPRHAPRVLGHRLAVQRHRLGIQPASVLDLRQRDLPPPPPRALVQEGERAAYRAGAARLAG